MPHAAVRLALVSALVLAPLAGRPAAAPAAAYRPTFARDVAPILYENCVACHRPGAVGPFPLVTYEDARRRAATLAAVVGSGLMPPWKPEERGAFVDERRLTPDQIATLRAWAEAGAPAGDLAEAPAPPAFRDGWQLGPPDLVLEVPREFEIPAEGPDVYVHFVVPVPVTTTTWVRAVEVLPRNRRVAHHAIGMIDASGAARRRAAASGGDFYPGLNAGFLPSAHAGGYVPGKTVRFPAEDSAFAIKPGSDFVLQMHYHPTGKPETDRPKIGLYFAPGRPKWTGGAGVVLGSLSLDIPAGAPDYAVSDAFTLPADLKVEEVWAHMHLIGKAVRVWAELPNGATRTLLTIDDWDFAWQDTYRYREPFWLPKGTVVRARFVFDNSSANPRNPSSPPRRVTYGDASTDEMAGVFVTGAARNWFDQLALGAAVARHYLTAPRLGRRAR